MAFWMDKGEPQEWLRDKDDTTCNDGSTNAVTVKLSTAIPLTWIRVVLKTTDLPQDIQLSFKTSTHWDKRTCIKPHVAQVNKRTLDILCVTDDAVEKLSLSGPGVKQLCSLYINKGRNVAVKESAKQSSLKNPEFSPSFAVNGHEDSMFVSSSSACTITLQDDPSWWKVTLSMDVHVTLFHIYTVNLYGTLQGFSLVARSRSNDFFTYQDEEEKPESDYIIVPSRKISFPVRTVKIVTRRNASLTLCELQIFGGFPPQDGRGKHHNRPSKLSDEQKELPLLNKTTNDIFYRCQLSLHLFHIHELAGENVYNVTVAERGSDDVASLLHHFFQTMCQLSEAKYKDFQVLKKFCDPRNAAYYDSLPHDGEIAAPLHQDLSESEDDGADS
ncbi:fucolectin-related protein [Elysia marginata]|uniref:Fucolectin-related protein n=1 Tax=Elysia marginata TaxID=1093978 RepID=A0AAV4IFR4_9GAST|nr:fucolectin-related protein [Elysia marginata]